MTESSTISDPVAHAGRGGRAHLLVDHLREVARLSGDFAGEFDSSSWAELAGLWHDLGKYSREFQSITQSPYGAAAHIETPLVRIDHSTAGAIHAIEQFGPDGMVLAYLIAGHHAGLPDWEAEEPARSLSQRLQKRELLAHALAELPGEEIVRQSQPRERPPGGSAALWVRMLFSCLIDGDLLDTEVFLEHDKAEGRSGYPRLPELAARLQAHLNGLLKKERFTLVGRLRADALRHCLEKAEGEPGFFSLTLPAGGGKTLASLAFAMGHALRYKKQRIFYVLPWTCGIEPVTDLFREIFGDSVIEHHANLDPKHETPQSRLASENWDAPVVVTTSAQLFETLFAARSSRVRKLHSLANSVVILDESQFVPPGLLGPVLRAIGDLGRYYKVTFLFSSATPRAWSEQKGPDFYFPGLDTVREIMGKPAGVHVTVKNLEVTVPDDPARPRTWEDLASELRKHERVLCVVDRRDECRHLFRQMPKGTIHLSGLMCGEHRAEIIADVRQRLLKGEPLRMISTRVIEAAADLDFPVVFRTLAGLDSLAQAAGRCNREGLAKKGKFFVFVPPHPAPSGPWREAQDAVLPVIEKNPEGLFTEESFYEYFSRLYWRRGDDLDRVRILADLEPDEKFRIRFHSAEKKFRILDENQQSPVIVLYGKSPLYIARLRRFGPERWLMRKLQRYVVNLPRQVHQKLLTDGGISEAHPGITIQAHEELYHSELGFLPFDLTYRDPDCLIV